MKSEDKIEEMLIECDMDMENANYHELSSLATSMYNEIKCLVPKNKRQQLAEAIVSQIKRTV